MSIHPHQAGNEEPLPETYLGNGEIAVYQEGDDRSKCGFNPMAAAIATVIVSIVGWYIGTITGYDKQ